MAGGSTSAVRRQEALPALTIVFGYDPGSLELRVVDATGFEADWIARARTEHVFRLGEERALVGLVAARREPLYVPNALSEPRWVAFAPTLRSGYFVPIVESDRLLGVFVLLSTVVDGLSTEHLALGELHARELARVGWLADKLDDHVLQRCNCGATGHSPTCVLALELQRVANKRSSLRPPLGSGREPVAALSELSPRELEIVAAMRSGLRLTEIARSFGISTHTARNHLKRVYRKLGVHSQVELLSVLDSRGVRPARARAAEPRLEVLYVEDNAQDADLLRRELARSAPQVTLSIVTGVEEAKARLRTHGGELHAVLIDLGLPDGSGFEIISEVKARGLHLPCIVLTGSAASETALSALQAGADDFLVKTHDHAVRLPAIFRAAMSRYEAESSAAAQPLRVLYAADNAAEVDLTLRHLERHAPHIEAEVVRTLADVLKQLPQSSAEPCAYQAVLLDYRAVDTDVLEVLKTMRDVRGLDIPVVVLAGQGDGQVGAQAFRFGATEYLVKHSGYLHALPVVLRSAHNRVELARQREALRQREQALQRSADRFRGVFEGLPDAVILVNAQGLITVANAQTSALFGHAPEALVGMPIEQLMPEAGRSTHIGQRERFLRSPKLRPMGAMGRQLWALKSDGTVFPVDICLSPLPAEDGMQVLAAIRDVSERVRVEREREGLETQLAQAQKLEAIGTLAGGIAHDFNNLLTILAISVDAMYQGLPSDHASRVELQQMEVAIARATELVRGILSFSRERPALLEPLQLLPLIEETTRLLRVMLPQAVELTTLVGANHLSIRADATQLHQVLLNLGTNAWHALEGRSGRVVIGVEDLVLAEPGQREGKSLPAGAYVHVWVSDTGVGMDEATQGRIFEPFFTTKPVGQGTGLGLSIVHGIVTTHGGFITVQSEPDHGTTFHLYFPAIEGAILSVPAPVQRAVTVPPRPLHVLLVDDEALLVRSAQRFLERSGHQVTGCSGAAEALQQVHSNPGGVDVIVADFNMPGQSGLDLAEALTRGGLQIPLVLASGYLTPAVHERAAAAGVRHTLQKPYSLHELLAIIEQCVEGRA